MSWWVLMMKAPAACANANDLGQDYVLEPLGSRAEVMALLGEVFPMFVAPDANATEVGILKLDDEGSEVHIPDGDPLMTLSFRPGEMEPIWRICERLGARLIDGGGGAFLSPDS